MGDFIFERCQLDNVMQITSKMNTDGKGSFVKSYEQFIFASHGIDFTPTEEYRIMEDGLVFRGIHFQSQKPQKRLLSVFSGSAYVTVVDLGKQSPQLGQYVTFKLTGKIPKSVFVPEWYGIATISLEDNTTISVMNDGQYYGEYSSGIRFNDSMLDIQWPVRGFSVSEKDKNLMSFSEYINL